MREGRLGGLPPRPPSHPPTRARPRPQAEVYAILSVVEEKLEEMSEAEAMRTLVDQHTVALDQQANATDQNTKAIVKLQRALRRALATPLELAAARAAPIGVGPAARDEVRLQPSAPSLAPGASSEPPLQALPSHLAPGASSGTGSSCSPLAERSGNSTNSPEPRRREQAAKPAAPPAALPVTAPPAAPPVAPLVEAPKSPRLQRTSGARSGKSTRP